MSDAGLSMGVEEEFLLVDPVTGATVARAEPVLARARAAPSPAPDTGLQAELLRTQVEAATGVCTRLAEVRRQLRESRALLADAARAEDARLVSTGTPVTAAAAPAFAFSPGERFQRIAEMGGGVFADYEVCGCHVHVGVPDRETALAVVNHLRPWLPTLVALAVNSPIDRGRDRGFASCRVTEKMGRFPCSGVPPWFESVAAYERELARLVDCGAMVDTAMTFWLARPSPRLPTVELRGADAVATVEDATLQAGLSRALVRTALADLAAGREAPRVSQQVCAVALWAAARYGMTGPGVHPLRERRVPAAELAAELIDHVTPALEETGDLAEVRALLAGVLRDGTGAERQRLADARGGPRAVLDLLVRLTAGDLQAERQAGPTRSMDPS
ncbi:putative glutamate--cysteine ligase 2 [Actinomadura sp. NBRC 104425]|uniref:carboxylate-amine ligase n=1 Tax=Actinomadura sp. NBRC 104425 TaxID=3032204 RepID=UPI0024A59291|nr:glutamate--cysteine ligase [Actinomadura sp. NBRC 104425]GLZ15724.1 putative glutamate--cysteine ligase 2 [Actinomadura sp. NBRC 104425]